MEKELENYLYALSGVPRDNTNLFNGRLDERPEKELERFIRRIRGNWDA